VTLNQESLITESQVCITKSEKKIKVRETICADKHQWNELPLIRCVL